MPFDGKLLDDPSVMHYLCLQQTMAWVDVSANIHWVERMSTRYKRNCINFMHRRQRASLIPYAWGEARIAFEHPLAIRGDIASLALERDIEEAARNRILDGDWILRVPLLQEMKRQIDDDIGGEDDGTNSRATDEEILSLKRWLVVRSGVLWKEADR